MTVYGEAVRIGDIILQEADGYFSRRVCTLAASQTIAKGQVLAGDPVNGSLTLLPAGADDVQTLTVASTAAPVALSYRDSGLAASVVYSAAASVMQAAVRALHTDLAACTVALPTTGTYTVTIPMASIPQDGPFLLEAANGTEVTVAHTTTGSAPGKGASAVALEAVTTGTVAGSITALVRDALVKDDYLSYGANVTSAPHIALVKKALESKGIVVRTNPTYTYNQDVVPGESVTTGTTISGT